MTERKALALPLINDLSTELERKAAEKHKADVEAAGLAFTELSTKFWDLAGQMTNDDPEQMTQLIKWTNQYLDARFGQDGASVLQALLVANNVQVPATDTANGGSGVVVIPDADNERAIKALADGMIRAGVAIPADANPLGVATAALRLIRAANATALAPAPDPEADRLRAEVEDLKRQLRDKDNELTRVTQQREDDHKSVIVALGFAPDTRMSRNQIADAIKAHRETVRKLLDEVARELNIPRGTRNDAELREAIVKTLQSDRRFRRELAERLNPFLAPGDTKFGEHTHPAVLANNLIGLHNHYAAPSDEIRSLTV